MMTIDSISGKGYEHRRHNPSNAVRYLIGSQRSKKKVLRALIRTSDKVRTLDRDFPITQIAWMSFNGELDSIGDITFQKDLMTLSKKVNEYKRRYWKLEEAIKQDFLHRMNKLRFSPSFSPELETLRTNLPSSVLKDDGRLWIFSFDYYIREIAMKVGRDPADAPKGEHEYLHYSKRFIREKDSLHKEALELLGSLNTFIAALKIFISSGTGWKGVERPDGQPDRIQNKRPLILIRRPFPLPRTKRPKKSIFRRLKRQTIGPGGLR
jgi:hypothetical protein